MNFSLALLAVVFTLNLSSMAIDKVVYGEDNRLDQFEITDQNILDLQRSTLAMIPKSKLKRDMNNSGSFKTIDSKIGLCDDARFNNQVDVAECSGFLIEKNNKQYVVTAGHCATSKSDCYDNYWVFDYAKKSPNDDARTIQESNIYSCKKIAVQSLNSSNGTDFALIELDRRVEDRKPLEYRQKSDIMKGEEIFVIGHPSGLPSKVAADAYVRDASDFWSFETNLDTFSGNSGSAVFNQNTGIVEGILVRGDRDYRYNTKKNCYEPNICNMDSCGGEDVFRINRIHYLRD
ncbi:trypsin [Bacteriovorax sp. BAL6_X]|uniref:trypsin-like serine peptidase n=1 Tax=Bacteriovorax sp. BAL6_X TaxID=1201290 RepID=UPI000385679E|nr:serine protease [Bacteriovorax sp. BAL6_X]EPZ52195.1 trypsin [Bacteriovorax sp. BAL6_X]